MISMSSNDQWYLSHFEIHRLMEASAILKHHHSFQNLLILGGVQKFYWDYPLRDYFHLFPMISMSSNDQWYFSHFEIHDIFLTLRPIVWWRRRLYWNFIIHFKMFLSFDRFILTYSQLSLTAHIPNYAQRAKTFFFRGWIHFHGINFLQ